GVFTDSAGVAVMGFVAKYLPGGTTLDSSFGTGGIVAWNYTSSTGATVPSDVRGVAAFIDPLTGTETIDAVGGISNTDMGDSGHGNYCYFQQLDSSGNLSVDMHTLAWDANPDGPNALNSITLDSTGNAYVSGVASRRDDASQTWFANGSLNIAT